MTKNRPHHIAPAIATARVVLVYKNFAPRGASSLVGLGVSSMMTAKTLRANGIWAEVWGVSSADDLRAWLKQAHQAAAAGGAVDPTHVVIAAPWIATADLESLAAAWPEIAFTVVSHSNFPFLQADPGAVRLLRDAARLQQLTHNVFVGGVTAKFTELASEIWRTEVALLPNLYDLDSASQQTRAPWRDGDTLRIGLFGALRVLKNPLSGVAAAIDLSAQLNVPTELYLSSGSDDQSPEAVAIDELTAGVDGFTVIRSPWRDWPTFRQLVARMNVLLQPSFTESFNIVTADGIAEGVPSVVSSAIDWVPSYWTANADDVRDIVRVAEMLLRNRSAANDGLAALSRYVTQGLQSWQEFLL
jgi:hypothetical protein